MPAAIESSIPAGHAQFVENMRYLWRFDPQLAFQIDQIEDCDRPAVELGKNGQPTIRVATAGGQSVYLHSRHDPISEAKKWAEAIPLDDRRCVIVCGFGLGYHLQALRRRIRGECLMVCVEPNLPVVAAALASRDLTDVLSSPRFVLLADADKARLHERLQPYSGLIMLGAQLAPYSPCRRLNGERFAQIESAILEYVSFARTSLMTLVGNSAITCKNIAMNLVTYVTTPPIDVLRDRFKGRPGVIISAGPSLRKNIDQLAALKGKAVLCAVQTALRPLAQKGIVPDFVTSLDYHEMSRRFFDEVDHSGIHLIAEPKATWHVIDHFKGPISLLDNAWARLVLGEELGARDGLPAGATVAHLAFYLAVYLGCDPIIFVGQDLAFTGYVYYVPGVEIHQSWRGEINRFNTMEQKEWDRIVRHRPILRKVPGNDGTILYTDELLFTYLEQFEKDIAVCPRRVMNCTEGGARIRGTQSCTLGQAAAEFCVKPMDAHLFEYPARLAGRDLRRLPAACAEVKARLNEIQTAHDICEELLHVLAELRGLVDQPSVFNRRIARVDELRSRIHADTRAYQIINMATQLAELRRFTADRSIEADDLSDAERARRQLARDIDFITGVRDGAVEVRKILEEALVRMESACG